MFENKDVVFGTVVACGSNNTLTVQLDNGDMGLVEAGEIGRRELNENSNLNWMIGRRYGYFAEKNDDEGFRILSGKAYENDQYEKIVSAFRAKERNVYTAHLSSTTKDGKLAFYMLAQGVNASVAVADFAYTRISSFNDIILPRELTVAIKEIDNQGRIRLYTKLAFGDFASSVERLSLVPGSVADGYVSGFVPTNCDAVVTLAPNLTVLTNRAAMGNWVKVQISRVNLEEQRLKGEITEDCGGVYKHFNFSEWCLDSYGFPAYVDIEEFECKIGPRKRGGKKTPTTSVMADEVQISYETSSMVSPFALREGEVGVRTALNGGSAKHIIFESQHGYLNENHMLAAKAVNDLKYTTAWQVQRYLHLKHGLKLTEKNLWAILNRLIKHDIIHTLRFSKDGQCSVQNILYPGATMYQAYTGSPRYLPTWAYSAEPDPAQIKCYLSANQLLLGIMHSWHNIADIENRVYIMTDSGLRIRPRHKVFAQDGEVVYLESARSNWVDGMLEKLQRYEAYLQDANEKAKVVITLEDEGSIASFVQRVADLHLSFDVLITCDLQCLPVPILQKVPACIRENETKKGGGFFSRLVSLFEEVKTA